jgi:hypothetical protein
MSDAGFQYTQQHYEEELAFRQRIDNSLHTIQEEQAAQRGMLEEQRQWQGEASHTLSQMHQEQARENQNLKTLLNYFRLG